MIHFIRLIRPVNLLIIVATMYGLGWYYDLIFRINGSNESVLGSLDFFLLVISTVMIAAAGNIINDYFDVKADRVNRPNRLIITKHIKRRWAIVFHWTLNLLAFSIAIYLSIHQHTFWYVFIHLLSINVLWFYSMQLKRTIVAGNVVIGLLTASVSILVGIFFQDVFVGIKLTAVYPFSIQSSSYFGIYLGIAFGVFAFILNWTREIIKDMEDVQGDLLLKAKTLPIVLGIQKTRVLAVVFLLLSMTLSIPIIWFWKTGVISGIAISPLLLSAIALIIALILLLQPISKRRLRGVNHCLKLTMIFGMFLPLFWIYQILN